MFMKYKVEIKEMLSRIIEIEAENEEGALKEITKHYKDGKIVLGAEDYIETEIDIYEEI